jgi:putative sterol carrier protein
VPAREFFETLEANVEASKIRDLNQTYLFDVTGEGRWLVAVRDGALSVTEGWEGEADTTITTSSETFERIASGAQNPMTAYMSGKLKVSGDLSAALKLQKLF